jgi:arginyl-tRNA synthetase
VTLAEVIEEVGKDVVRFTMLTRKSDAQMDFDFAKVVEASKDNPVFYVQYAHARIASTIRKAGLEGLGPNGAHVALLGDAEIGLIRETANFPRIVEAAAKSGEPHRIAFYLNDLSAAFHAYWNLGNDQPDKRFILAQNPELTGARLFMAHNIGQVLRNGLRLMGVEAAYNM